MTFAALARQVVDALPECLAVVDLTGRIIAVNEPWKRDPATSGAAEGDLLPPFIASAAKDVCRPGGLHLAVEDGRSPMVGLRVEGRESAVLRLVALEEHVLVQYIDLSNVQRADAGREWLELQRMASSETGVTAAAYGMAPLSEAFPARFDALVAKFQMLLDLALERKVYKIHETPTSTPRSMADELGRLRAGPRDIIDIYREAITRRASDSPPGRLEAARAEGRLLVLELMGHVLAIYRTYSLFAAPANEEGG